MGAVLAKFRKEKSSAEILEKLETEITTIEKYSIKTQEKQRRLVGNFLAISFGLYALACIIIFFWFPKTWPDRVIYSVPILAFPMIIFLVRRLLAWYFQRKITKNSSKLVKLRAEKKKILEEVMEKETYNVASKLLSKYGGEKTYGIKSATVLPLQPSKTQTTESRINNLNSSLNALASNDGMKPFVNLMAPNQSLLSAAANSGPSTVSPRSPRGLLPATPQHPSSSLRYRGPAIPSSSALAYKKSLPFPIINQKSQSLLEKLVDYLIGDGPQNRYALICKECSAHNGMARAEDFDYTTYRCAFCNALNPSRKSRPVAPKIISSNAPQTLSFSARTSDSSSESTNESELDIPKHCGGITSLQVKERTDAQDVPDVQDELKVENSKRCSSQEDSIWSEGKENNSEDSICTVEEEDNDENDKKGIEEERKHVEAVKESET